MSSPDSVGDNDALRPGSLVCGRYRIERELGRGAMATVYLVCDLPQERLVALKMLHPELSGALGDRFLREIAIATRLQHPNILPLFDSGAAAQDGGAVRSFYVMPYVAGESLRARLLRETQLGLDEAIRICGQVAAALDYAHSQGIVHRDIKPENILLEAEQAVVADFGVATALDAAGGEKLTQTGISLGTPAYMSPEQASARRVDARSDVYSLACVMYEMLVGDPPFVGSSARAVMARHALDPVPSVRTARPEVPAHVEAALRRGLAKVPGDRYASAGEFAAAVAGSGPALGASSASVTRGSLGAALATGESGARRRTPVWVRWSLATGLLLAVATVPFLRSSLRPAEVPPVGAPKVLAVLPFENLGQVEDEYFTDGLTDAVRGKLADLPGVLVIARNSSNPYRRSSKAPQQIARELGVQYLLTGTVRWEKGTGVQNRVQVSPELMEMASEGAPVTKWQQPFDAVLSDVFQVQADIAGRVAQALDIELGAGERKALAEQPTADLGAYDAFLKGEQISNSVGASEPVTLRNSASYYRRAVALDSTFALAWAQLSRVHSIIYTNSVPRPADAEQARRAAERAVALAPTQPDGHLALGNYYYFVTGDYARAINEYAQGQRLAGNSADLLTATALAEQSQGRWNSALEHLQRAHRLDPRSVLTIRRLARVLLWLRHYPEALAATDLAMGLAPENPDGLENKAMVFLARGDLAGARAVLKGAPRELEPTALVAYLAAYWDLVWVMDDAQQALLLRLTPAQFDDDRGFWGIALAQTYWLRGDSGKARAYADSARIAFEAQLREAPDDGQRRVLLGQALAYLGRKAEAVREGEKGLSLLPISQDAYQGAYNQHQLVRVYILVGEQNKALDRLEPLLKLPYYLSPGWLSIDPNFDPLRKHPRFQRLVEDAR